MADASTELDALFEKLATFIKNNQHKKALKTADESGSRSTVRKLLADRELVTR